MSKCVLTSGTVPMTDEDKRSTRVKLSETSLYSRAQVRGGLSKHV